MPSKNCFFKTISDRSLQRENTDGIFFSLERNIDTLKGCKSQLLDLFREGAKKELKPRNICAHSQPNRGRRGRSGH